MLSAACLAILLVAAPVSFSVAASTLTLGPRAVQTLLADQLFNRHGRWYLIDDGGVCFTYLQSPRTRIAAGRLELRAHLVSRLGQRAGTSCLGTDFNSEVLLSGKIRGLDHTLLLDDIRIDRVDDEATRTALNLALQLDPQALTRVVDVDVLDLMRRQATSLGGAAVHVDQFRVASVVTRADAVVIQFDVALSAP